MGFFYAILWFIVAFILIFTVSKENKIFYFAGGFFVLLGVWWLVDSLMPENNFFGGAWGIALQIVTLIALVVLSAFFLIERNRSIKREMAEKKMSEDKKDE